MSHEQRPKDNASQRYYRRTCYWEQAHLEIRRMLTEQPNCSKTATKNRTNGYSIYNITIRIFSSLTINTYSVLIWSLRVQNIFFYKVIFRNLSIRSNPWSKNASQLLHIHIRYERLFYSKRIDCNANVAKIVQMTIYQLIYYKRFSVLEFLYNEFQHNFYEDFKKAF